LTLQFGYLLILLGDLLIPLGDLLVSFSDLLAEPFILPLQLLDLLQ